MKYFILFCLMMSSCGDSGEVVEYKDPAPKQEPKPKPPVDPVDPIDPVDPVVDPGTEPEDLAKDRALAAVQASCTSCHNTGFQSPPFENEAQVIAKVDRICNRVGNGTMPPGGNISDQARQAILDGLCK